MKKRVILFALVFLCAIVAHAQQASPPAVSMAAPPPGAAQSSAARLATIAGSPEKTRPVRIPRFDKAPTVDGRLDEEVWSRAAVLGNFYQTSPGDNISPSKPTEVLIGYDANNLFIAFRAHDEPGKVRATVAKRDAVFDDDNVGILLDTFNDKRKAYRLFFNPLGVQADGIFTVDGGDNRSKDGDLSVDILMESKGVVAEDC